jgi:hypothetical protein
MKVNLSLDDKIVNPYNKLIQNVKLLLLTNLYLFDILFRVINFNACSFLTELSKVKIYKFAYELMRLRFTLEETKLFLCLCYESIFCEFGSELYR